MVAEPERGGGLLGIAKNIGSYFFNVSANQGNDDEGVKGDGSKVGWRWS